MRLLLHLSALLGFLSLAATSCMKDEDYTTSFADALTFSRDTVAFDTVLSGQPTSTATFTVYNPNGKAIRVPSVRLAKGAASPFAVTVDGTPLRDGAAADFEIASKDSMVVFLMAKLPYTDSDAPVPAEDDIVFTTEAGREQRVALRAVGQDVLTLPTGMRVTSDTVMAPSRPVRIMDSLVVERGATLTLAEGTRWLFHSQARLIVHGTLRIAGTQAQPVVLRGDRTDNMFNGQPYDRIPGQWGGITLTSESYGNVISYADIHSGSWGVRADSSDVTRSKLLIENSAIHNTQGNGLDVRMSQVTAGNCQFTNAGGDCVRAMGGDVVLIHCTVARFYVFTGGDGVALRFANYDGKVTLPLSRLAAYNCIVTGYASDELMGAQSTTDTQADFKCGFFNCLIRTPDNEDTKKFFSSCLLDDGKDGTLSGADNFTPAFDTSRLLFSFQLAPASKAVGSADNTISEATYPLDPQGRSRTGDTAPDMGCYQHATQ